MKKARENKACETLFMPFAAGDIKPEDAVLFVNAAPCEGLGLLSGKTAVLQQTFKPHAAALQEAGFTVTADFPAKAGGFDHVLVAATKNKAETQYYLAMALRMLREGGTIACAGSNDAGGTRLAGFFKALGLENYWQESKNKARVVWAEKPGFYNENLAKEWLEAGSEQEILGGRFLSRPGLFGWDKIDKGSGILLQHLPKDLSGTGADFGCGYGYLADFLLRHNPSIKELFCIDADHRAVAACGKNLDRVSHQAQKEFVWADLTNKPAELKNLDWIVMNPPFHEGKNTDIGVGQAFIKTAAKALKPGGILYMVANAALPYEKDLESEFKGCSKKYEGQGFKIFSATK